MSTAPVYALSPPRRCAPPARHRAPAAGGDRPRGAAHRARARARRPAHRGDAAGRRRGRRSSSSRRPPGSARPRCSSTPRRRRPEAGCRVRRAAPGPLERHFGFGVVRALLEGALRDASDERRARLLEGAAAPAGALLLDGAVPGADATMAIAHSVLWLCSALADEAPLMLVVDDAHWADRPSLEVLAYLARRIADLPLLIAVGARADDPDAASDLLSLIGGARAATVLHPQPLTRRGAARLIRRAAPSAPLEVCRECHRAAAGNPWLLGELGRQIADHGAERARRVRRRRPAAQRDRAHRRPRAPGRAVAARPRRRRGARRDRRGRAAPGRRGRGRRRARRARRRPRRAAWPPGCSAPAARASRTTSSPARSATTCPAGAASACTARRRAP